MTLKVEVARVFKGNFGVYGVRRVWRLMRDMGVAGVRRGKPVRTTMSDKAAPCPLDHVNRQFHAPAPNMLWVSDFIYVSTWNGFAYVAFVIMGILCSRRVCYAGTGGLVQQQETAGAHRQHPAR
jgi:putative transposase